MSVSLFLFSPIPPQELSALVSEFAGAVHGYVSAHGGDGDEQADLAEEELEELNAFPIEIVPLGARATGAASATADGRIRDRLAKCRSALEIERPDPNSAVLASCLRLLVPRCGQSVVAWAGEPQLAEDALASIKGTKGLRGFGASRQVTPRPLVRRPTTKAHATGAEKRAGMLIAAVRRAHDHPDEHHELRAGLDDLSPLAKRYLLLLAREGILDDDESAELLDTTPKELAAIMPELEQLLATEG